MPIHKEQMLFKNWSKFRKQDSSFAILTTSDYALLEDFLENDPVTQGESALLLRRLVRHKMTRTRTPDKRQQTRNWGEIGLSSWKLQKGLTNRKKVLVSLLTLAYSQYNLKYIFE